MANWNRLVLSDDSVFLMSLSNGGSLLRQLDSSDDTSGAISTMMAYGVWLLCVGFQQRKMGDGME